MLFAIICGKMESIVLFSRQEVPNLQDTMSLKCVQSVSWQIDLCDLDWTHPRGRHGTGEYLQIGYVGILNA